MSLSLFRQMKNLKKNFEYNIHTMSTTYHPFKIALTDGQKKNFKKLMFQRQLLF